MEKVIDPIYLKKSIYFYKIYGILFLFSLLMTIVGKPIFKNKQETLDLLIALPFLGVIVMAPIGLFYSWKSFKRKEGKAQTRFIFFIGHFFFCLLVIGLLAAIVSDISQII